MYISHESLQAIYQDTVNAALARSERRRMLKAAKQTDTRVTVREPKTNLRAVFSRMLGIVARP